MFDHLAASTVFALICILAALALRRRGAAFRHAILFIAILRFAAYTPWLTAAGASLAPIVHVRGVALPPFAHTAKRLLYPDARPAISRALPAPTTQKIKGAAGWLWFMGAAFGFGMWLGALVPPRGFRDALFWERELLLEAAGTQPVGLRILPAGQVPGAQGFMRPRVLLPDGLAADLTDAEMGAVLSHEVAHLRRRDPLIAGVVRAIVAIFWFHPLLWWIERRMLSERESACDEMVLGAGANAEAYAAGLAKVCRNAVVTRVAYAPANGADLSRRIDKILSRAPSKSSRAFRFAPAVLAVPLLIPVANGLLRAQTLEGQADGLYQAAENARRAGDLNRALDLFRRSEEAGNLRAALAAGLILDSSGRWPEALIQYEKVIKDDPDNAVALNNAAYLLADNGGNLDRALVYAVRARELKSDAVEIADTLGWVYVKRNAPDQALLAFRDLLLKAPNNWTFRSHLAQALDEERDPPGWMRELRGVIFGSTRESESRMRELLAMIGK